MNINLRSFIGLIDFSETSLAIYKNLSDYMDEGTCYIIDDLVSFKRFIREQGENALMSDLNVEYINISDKYCDTITIVLSIND